MTDASLACAIRLLTLTRSKDELEWSAWAVVIIVVIKGPRDEDWCQRQIRCTGQHRQACKFLIGDGGTIIVAMIELLTSRDARVKHAAVFQTAGVVHGQLISVLGGDGALGRFVLDA